MYAIVNKSYLKIRFIYVLLNIESDEVIKWQINFVEITSAVRSKKYLELEVKFRPVHNAQSELLTFS